jgi:threonine dehydratase
MSRSENLLSPNNPFSSGLRSDLPERPLSDQIAALSQLLLPLMQEHDIRAAFGRMREGVYVLDATRNTTGAYKVRGALAATLAAQLQGSQSVWTASAGNHGAGVAMAAKLLGLQATVYVPETAPEVKVTKIRGFGAQVVRTGNGFDECLDNARRFQTAGRSDSAFVHPFDDQIVAAGQGTLGLELFEHFSAAVDKQCLDAVRVFIPIGGGGLISGIASTLRQLWPTTFPRLEIIGVVDESSPASMVGTLFGRPVCALPDTIADGTRVALVGHTFLKVCTLVDYIMPVPHDAIVATMREYAAQRGEMLEASGALALTGESFVRRYSLLPRLQDSLHYAVVSGRNIDSETFESVVSQPSRRCERSQCRMAYQVQIPEKDGELLRFLNCVREFNIASLTYKQESATLHGGLHVNFEVLNSCAGALHDRLLTEFPGSRLRVNDRSVLLPIDEPVAQHFRDELVTLEDHPGSFADYIQCLHDSGTLGRVGFLFYRQPSQPGAKAQVIIGRAPTRRQDN